MISGPPPGRISRLVTAWVNWLFDKLQPPAPARIERTQPPQLVRVGRDVTGSPANDARPLALRSEAR